MPYSDYDIYVIYKKVEAYHKNKEYKQPKNLNSLSKENKEKLEKMSGYFNTIYHNINPKVYMHIGFKLWKTFGINKMDDPKIHQKYISFDKKMKREYNPDKKRVKSSINYINSFDDVFEYCNNGEVIREPVKDYIQNKMDCVTLCFLLEKRIMKPLNGEEKNMLSYFINNYTEIKQNMYSKYDLLQKHINI